jgi:hypothetical protein
MKSSICYVRATPPRKKGVLSVGYLRLLSSTGALAAVIVLVLIVTGRVLLYITRPNTATTVPMTRPTATRDARAEWGAASLGGLLVPASSCSDMR